MALTQADIDALEKAYAGGEKSITLSDGRRVEFHSAAEFERRLAYVKSSVDAAAGTSAPRQMRSVAGKGV
jgi:hypothetical protein